MSERWPLHPLPTEFELLRPWVRRIAESYGVSYHLFCLNVLNLDRYEADRLNQEPGEEVLEILSRGSALPIERLREMTMTGMFQRANVLFEEEYRRDPEGFECRLKRMEDASIEAKRQRAGKKVIIVRSSGCP
jgi:hypothetical protein